MHNRYMLQLFNRRIQNQGPYNQGVYFIIVLWADYLEESAQVNRFQWTPCRARPSEPNLDVTLKPHNGDGAEFLIRYQRLAFLSNFSWWQLIQNSASSTIMWRQCDIWVGCALLCQPSKDRPQTIFFTTWIGEIFCFLCLNQILAGVW